jgi:hypothetical protein
VGGYIYVFPSRIKVGSDEPPFNFCPSSFSAKIFGLYDQKDQARRAARQVLRVNPKFSVDYYEKRSPIKDNAMKGQLFSALRESCLK